MIKLEKGAQVKVRLHNGEVVEAVYTHRNTIDFKVHHVQLPSGEQAIAWGRKPMPSETVMAVRFVGNPCVLLHEGVSNEAYK